MNITDIIERLGKPRILVIGDLMLDRYVWGKVDRISPEAPIQILNVQSKDNRLGGAANVANNLISLEAQIDCLGVLGNDEAGRQLKSRLNATKAGTAGIIMDSGRTTPVKTRLIAHNQQVLRVDEEKPQPISRETEARLIRQIKSRIKQCDAVLISDYNKGVLTEAVLNAVCRSGRRLGKPVLVDPKGRDYRKYAGASGLTPNRAEVQQATGIEIKDNLSRRKAASTLIKQLKLDFLIITLGEEGIYLLDKSGREVYDPAKPLTVYDVTGAGDTVLAALGMALSAGLDYRDALHLANLAAGVVVSKVGTATVSRDDIIEHFNLVNNGHSAGANKIKRAAELAGIIAKLRMTNRTARPAVAFTNGCFDILHPGHIKSLTFARQQGDILVVGLNSDKSVRTIKGKGRPIFNQSLRARSLAALECVDYVAIFDEPTPLSLIRRIKPDILVKGADWKGRKVVGAEVLKSSGGRVVFAPLEKGISTTNIIKSLDE